MGADMLAFQILILGIILLVIPVVAGSLFLGMDRRTTNLPFAWVSGQMLLWAGFQLITVPLVLKEEEFTKVVYLFSGYMILLVILALLRLLVRKKKGVVVLRPVEEASEKPGKSCYILWALFWGVFIFQLVQAFRLAYADGDDAYYVAISTITEEADTMYRKLAYTGGATSLDVRYGLAPFPLWISFLARVSGMRTVSVAQVIVPPVLIAMAYAVFYLVGSRLYARNKERVPMFMIFVELLVLFGNYSIYTAERFLIERSRQGKAALCSLIIPLLIFLLLLLMEKIQDDKKVALGYWVIMLCSMIAACLCSTLGTLLVSMLVGITGLCAAISYRRWKILIPLAGCCIPCVIFALLYVVL